MRISSEAVGSQFNSGRSYMGIKMCIRKHPQVNSNIYRRSDGRTDCRECRAERQEAENRKRRHQGDRKIPRVSKGECDRCGHVTTVGVSELRGEHEGHKLCYSCHIINGKALGWM